MHSVRINVIFRCAKLCYLENDFVVLLLTRAEAFQRSCAIDGLYMISSASYVPNIFDTKKYNNAPILLRRHGETFGNFLNKFNQLMPTKFSKVQ